MQTLRRIAAVLTFPAIAYLGAACERDTPTEARPGGMALTVSGDLTDALSTDLGLSDHVRLPAREVHGAVDHDRPELDGRSLHDDAHGQHKRQRPRRDVRDPARRRRLRRRRSRGREVLLRFAVGVGFDRWYAS